MGNSSFANFIHSSTLNCSGRRVKSNEDFVGEKISKDLNLDYVESELEEIKNRFDNYLDAISKGKEPTKVRIVLITPK